MKFIEMLGLTFTYQVSKKFVKAILGAIALVVGFIIELIL